MDAPVGDVRLNKAEHLLGGLGSLDEHTVVNLEEAEELEDFAGFWRNLVDTIDTHGLVFSKRDV